MSVASKKKSNEAIVRDLRSRIDSLENELDDLRGDISDAEFSDDECLACQLRDEKRGNPEKVIEGLASRMVREVTCGDISWLPFEEQERYRLLARIAVVELAP